MIADYLLIIAIENKSLRNCKTKPTPFDKFDLGWLQDGATVKNVYVMQHQSLFWSAFWKCKERSTYLWIAEIFWKKFVESDQEWKMSFL